jgi:DNA mismatch endonuclease, patch repair protein
MSPEPTLAEVLLRSRTMASVRSSRTDLEQRLAKEMWAVGLRGWRRQRRVERAKPDFLFTSARVAVFVDGCFWHWCPDCDKFPATNRDYWLPKLQRNRDRDREQTEALEAAGYAVLRFWGHEIDTDAAACARHVRARVGAGRAKSRSRCALAPS